MRLLGLLLTFAAGAAFAGEYAVLTSGARLHADRHESAGSTIRLYNGSGYIEMHAAGIRHFEVDEYVPPVAAVSEPPAVFSSGQPRRSVSPRELADAAADKYGLPRRLVRSVMAAESGFEPKAISPKGAIGLMQLMPSTARLLGANPHDAAENVDAGTRYLRDLLDKYDGGLRHALAAYNAGPAAVEKYRGGQYKGVPPYRETINYILRIEKDLKKSGD